MQIKKDKVLVLPRSLNPVEPELLYFKTLQMYEKNR